MKFAEDRHGYALARLVRALVSGGGNLDRARSWASDNLGAMSVEARALAAGQGDAGGFAVPTDILEDFSESLRPVSAVRRLGAVIVPVTPGTSRVRVTVGAQAAYLGENDPIVSSELQTGSFTFSPRKLGALMPLSNSLIRYQGTIGDRMVRDELSRAAGAVENAAFIRGNGTQHQPKGLRHWAPAGNIIASAGSTFDNIRTDLSAMLAALEDADVPMVRPGWMLHPRSKRFLSLLKDDNGSLAFAAEMARGTLLGVPFASTTAVPKNLGSGSDESEVYLSDFAQVAIGEAGFFIDAGRAATWHEGEDHITGFDHDQTAVRLIAEHDLSLRHEEAVAVLTGVTWGAS